MARKRPINETQLKRNRFFPCRVFEKLHVVLIKYENTVATRNATPFASAGVGDMT